MYSLYMLKLSGCTAVSHLWRNTFLGNVWFLNKFCTCINWLGIWSLLCVYNHHIECNHLIWTSFCLCDLYWSFSSLSFHCGWLFLLGCGDCCCWLNCEHLLLLGFWYFLSLILMYWCLNKLIEAFSPVFALVDKYCPVALCCSIVFAKFLIFWGGLKLEGLASSFDSCSITCCVVPWLLKLNRKVSLWNALCSSGLKLHKSHSLSILL